MTHNEGVSHSRRRKQKTHPLLTALAVEVAREAIAELGEGEVGEHIGVSGVTSTVATHRFAANLPGYSGWEWNAVVARAEGSTYVTVNEVALVPTPAGDALQAPEWVPYFERLQPGDLKPGDLMPPPAGDERLTGEEEEGVGVGKPGQTNYLTPTGLADAEERWRRGDFGPTSDFAEQSEFSCHTCAFYLPLAEPVGADFGACVNEFSADGIVVNADYGCGAHSQTTVQEVDDAEELFDDERPIF